MNEFATTTDLAELGIHIANDGFASHEAVVARIVEQGLTVDPMNPALHVLADTNQAEVVRARALAVTSRQWHQIHERLEHQARDFDQSMGELLDLWSAQQGRQTPGAVPSGTARTMDKRIDALRWAVAVRRADIDTSAA